jgi:hypothetical protein
MNETGEFNYHAYELRKLGDTSEGVKVKLRGDNGETRWLLLTPEELAGVSAVLTGE